LLAETAELKVGDEARNEFDEGYQYFIALGIVLLLLAARGRMTTMAMLCLLIIGCDSCRKMREPPAEYHQRMQAGINAWSVLQSVIADNPELALTMLDGAREEFLKAAMLSPGDMQAACYITGVSAQMCAVEAKVRELQQSERQVEQSIEQLVKQLRELTLREEKLARDARTMLRAYPPPKEDEKIAHAAVVAAEQQPIAAGTAEVVSGIETLQERVRQIIGGAFEHADSAAVTEFDEVAELLKSAAGSQKEIAEQLALQKPALNKAADALVVAARVMRQSLELLSQAQKQDDAGNQDQSEMDEWEFEEDVEWSESSDDASMPMSIRSSSFNSALNNRDIPVPNYTAEEILAEEQKNLSERSRKKESRAGARVEKNW
jgi:Ca-activated chloride channel homolog